MTESKTVIPRAAAALICRAWACALVALAGCITGEEPTDGPGGAGNGVEALMAAEAASAVNVFLTLN